MEVRKTRLTDSAEPDVNGFVDYFYEYDMYEFVGRGLSLTARSYTDNGHEAHFLGRQGTSSNHLLKTEDFEHPLFLEAVAILKAEGKTEVNFLTEHGYMPVPRN